MASLTRQVYRLEAGNLDNLRLETDTLPAPAPHEVTVAVRTIGLNFADVFAIWGLYSATPKGVFTPGLEYAGEIIAVGSAVTERRVGERVMGVTRFGGYATYLNTDYRYVLPVPEGWTDQQGAAYLVQGLTAYYGLIHLGNLQRGDTVLVHSAAGGVGTLAARIARRYDAYLIGTVGRPDKVDYCRAEGYAEVIVRGADFGAQLDAALGDRELRLIMECIGGEVLKAGYDRLGPEGRSVVYGSARYAQPKDKPNRLKLIWQFLRRPKIDPQEMIHLNKGILGFNLIYLYERAEFMHELLGEMAGLDLGAPNVGVTFSFAELPDAVRRFSTGATTGKVVVNV